MKKLYENSSFCKLCKKKNDQPKENKKNKKIKDNLRKKTKVKKKYN